MTIFNHVTLREQGKKWSIAVVLLFLLAAVAAMGPQWMLRGPVAPLILLVIVNHIQ